MNLNRRLFVSLLTGALSFCVADVHAGIPPLPPGARPAHGMMWCPRCHGRRRVPSGFLGWTSKPCPDCRATGMVRLPPPPPPPPAVRPRQHREHREMPPQRPMSTGPARDSHHGRKPSRH